MMGIQIKGEVLLVNRKRVEEALSNISDSLLAIDKCAEAYFSTSREIKEEIEDKYLALELTKTQSSIAMGVLMGVLYCYDGDSVFDIRDSAAVEGIDEICRNHEMLMKTLNDLYVSFTDALS